MIQSNLSDAQTSGRMSGRWFSPGVRFHATAIVLLIALLVAAYFNVIFLGQTLVASSNYHPFDFRWNVIQTGGFQGNAFVNWYDLGGVWWQWEPAAAFFSKEYRKGRVPLWDPMLAGGVDAHIGLVQGQYYPPYVLLLLLGNTPALRDAYYLIQLFIAGLFCYFLMRRHGCAYVSGVVTAACYMLGGALTQTVNSILGQAFAVLPLMVWSIDYATRKSEWRRAGIAGLILGLCALTSFLPIVISGYLLIAIYIFVNATLDIHFRAPGDSRVWRQLLKPWAICITAVVVSLLLIAFLLLPVQLASMRDPIFSKWYHGIGLQTFPPELLLTLVSPSISYDMWQTRDPNAQMFASKYTIGFFYTGLIPLALAVLARPGREPGIRKLFWFFLASSCFVLLKLCGIPPVQWLGHFPVFNTLHFTPYFCGALGFSIAGLAGLGVESVVRKRNPVAIGMVMLVLIAFITAVIRFAQTEPVNPALQPPLLWSAIARFGMEFARLTLAGAGLLMVVVLRTRMISGRLAGLFILGLVAVELVPLANRHRFLRSDVWNNVPNYVHFLQSDPTQFRVHGIHDLALTPNVGQGLGIDTVSSRVSFNSERYSNMIRRYFTVPDIPYPLAKSLLPTSRVILDLLNTKYVLLFSPSPGEIEGMNTAGLTPALEDGSMQIFHNPRAWPRAYVARTVRVVNGAEQSLEAIANLEPNGVVVEEKPSTAAVEAAGVVEWTDADFETVTMRVHSTGPALLVLGENASPGWKATVNGRQSHILIANHAFQAVEIPAGVSEVRFEYETPGLNTGCLVSATGLLFALGIITVPVARKRMRSV